MGCDGDVGGASRWICMTMLDWYGSQSETAVYRCLWLGILFRLPFWFCGLLSMCSYMSARVSYSVTVVLYTLFSGSLSLKKNVFLSGCPLVPLLWWTGHSANSSICTPHKPCCILCCVGLFLVEQTNITLVFLVFKTNLFRQTHSLIFPRSTCRACCTYWTDCLAV